MTESLATPANRSIPIARPMLGEEEARAVADVLASGWIVQGPKVAEFEGSFAAFTGTKHAVAASSCTTALHMAVAALGLKPGDEVIVPAFTWISTANVVEYMGAKPVFVDIDPHTFNLNPALVADAVTDQTVGILPVHLFGLCADMDGVNRTAQENGLWVVEDAACAFGAWHPRGHAGTLGTAGAFSFHPRKAITTGEGGMVTTADDALATAARSLRDHGADRSDHARHNASDGMLLPRYARIGYNYRMTDLQAAVGVVQMGRAPHILQTRLNQAKAYDTALSELPWLHAPHVPEGYTHGYQSYVAWFGDEAWEATDVGAASARRDRCMVDLQRAGVATRQGTHAAALQEYYAHKYRLTGHDFPVAHAAERLTLSLPLYAAMTEDDQRFVTEALRNHQV